MDRILSHAPLVEIEKLTKHIRVGPLLAVTERLHTNLVKVSQLTGNAPMQAALRMSAQEGSDIIIERYNKRTQTILDEDIQSEEDEKTLRAYCLETGMSRTQAKRELLRIQLYFQRECEFPKPWHEEEEKEKAG